MLGLFDKVLSKLPGNGWKSVVGYVLQYVPIVVPGFPVALAGDAITKVGEALLALGLIHKAVKEARKRK